MSKNIYGSASILNFKFEAPKLSQKPIFKILGFFPPTAIMPVSSNLVYLFSFYFERVYLKVNALNVQ